MFIKRSEFETMKRRIDNLETQVDKDSTSYRRYRFDIFDTRKPTLSGKIDAIIKYLDITVGVEHKEESTKVTVKQNKPAGKKEKK